MHGSDAVIQQERQVSKQKRSRESPNDSSNLNLIPETDDSPERMPRSSRINFGNTENMGEDRGTNSQFEVGGDSEVDARRSRLAN